MSERIFYGFFLMEILMGNAENVMIIGKLVKLIPTDA